MIKTKISEDIYVYQFLVNPNTGYSINLTAVFDHDNFVLVDAGYEEQIKELMSHLDFKKCKYILFTHQHPDHTFGAKLLNNIELVGHKDFETGFKECVEWMGITDWTIDGTVPTKLVEDNEKLIFGKHTFTFIHHPYHTSTHMLIDLNNEYIFTGDEILTTYEGKFMTSIYFAPTEILKEAYSKLRLHTNNRIVIPGHGILNLGDVESRINEHEIYLSLVKKGILFDGLKNFGINCDIYRHFHDYNLKHHSSNK